MAIHLIECRQANRAFLANGRRAANVKIGILRGRYSV